MKTALPALPILYFTFKLDGSFNGFEGGPIREDVRVFDERLLDNVEVIEHKQWIRSYVQGKRLPKPATQLSHLDVRCRGKQLKAADEWHTPWSRR